MTIDASTAAITLPLDLVERLVGWARIAEDQGIGGKWDDIELVEREIKQVKQALR